MGFSAGQAISYLDALSVDRAELESSATARRGQWWRSEKLGAGCGTGLALMMAIDRALQDWRRTLGNLSAMPPASSPIEPASGVAVIGKPQRFAEAWYPNVTFLEVRRGRLLGSRRHFSRRHCAAGPKVRVGRRRQFPDPILSGPWTKGSLDRLLQIDRLSKAARGGGGCQRGPARRSRNLNGRWKARVAQTRAALGLSASGVAPP